MEERKTEQDNEINLLDYLIILLKHKKLIIGSTCGIAVITTIICLILPPVYQAETRVLPPQQTSTSLAAMIAGGIGGTDIASSLIGLKTPAELYIGMVESRTVLDKIINRFDLMKLYDKKHRIDAEKEILDDILEAAVDSKSGLIIISIEDKDPKRAADMANAFVDELKNLSKGLAVTEAAQRRLFFEEQLKDTKTSLMKAEEAMESFQEKTGALQVEEQAKAVIEGIAALRAQIAAKEVEIKVMKTYSTPNDPDLQRSEEAIRGLKAEQNKLEVKSGSGHDPLMPTGRMPEVGIEYERKLRDVKFNETLFELLTKQYEAAKLDEARDAAVIQIVDTAIPPDKKAKPKTVLVVLIATFLGFLLSIVVAFFTESIRNSSKDPENRERFNTIKKNILFWKRG